LGWPSTKLEEWKYTNVGPIARVDWRASECGGEAAALESGGSAAALRKEFTFVNGRGATSATSHPLFAKYADYMRHPFVALNTANAQDGALIVIPDSEIVDGFIDVRFIGEGDPSASLSAGGVWSHPRNLIVVGRN